MKKTVLICYDITCPKRLGRVHRYLKVHAIPIQYSIFVTRVTRRQLNDLIDGLQCKILRKEDDVRIYELPSDYTVDLLGRQAMEDEIVLHHEGLEKILGIDNG